MNNSFDSTSLLEHLGIYDFLNVLLSGSIFTFCICIIHSGIKEFICSNITFVKGLGIILLIYIIGMLLQELGTVTDTYIFKIHKRMRRSILKGEIDTSFKRETSNKINKNPITLTGYRKFADELLKNVTSNFDNNEQRFENEYVNGYVFSTCQYYVSVNGKDKKVEKLLALFDMSRTLMSCFFLLSFFALLSVFIKTEPSINIFNIIGLSNSDSINCTCTEKCFFAIVFFAVGILFYYRARKMMKNFLLILLGTYNALVHSLDNHQ